MINKVKNYKPEKLFIVLIACILVFQPAHKGISQPGERAAKPELPKARDNSEQIQTVIEKFDSSLKNIKSADKSLDAVVAKIKAAKQSKIVYVYRTKWLKPEKDTVYLDLDSTAHIPEFNFYKQDEPDTVFVHDTVMVEVNKPSFMYKLTHRGRNRKH